MGVVIPTGLLKLLALVDDVSNTTEVSDQFAQKHQLAESDLLNNELVGRDAGRGCRSNDVETGFAGQQQTGTTKGCEYSGRHVDMSPKIN